MNHGRQIDLRASRNRGCSTGSLSDTSMTIPDFHASARDETGRPEAPSGPGLGQEGWTPEGLLYDAFISYSWGNLDVADKIERDLERFPLPPKIRRRLGRRHLNVFRDENDLTGNVLDAALEHHLEQSRTLVVLCSPAARRSENVTYEIKRFAELREAGQIVPVLIAGGPNNDASVDPRSGRSPTRSAMCSAAFPSRPTCAAIGASRRRPNWPDPRRGFSSLPTLSVRRPMT